MRIFAFILAFLISSLLHGQTETARIIFLEKAKKKFQIKLDSLEKEKERELFQYINKSLKNTGLPTEDELTWHNAYVLKYNEDTEQADWVMHMILPEIKEGVVLRTNDFREDPLITTGSATQIDYFLTDTLANGEVEYDGFGFDRGHLAPSADFRWSQIALSESYYYSNISPQVPELNREAWAKLEDRLRKYVIANNRALIIATAPVFENNRVLNRSVNKLSIPSSFIKMAIDPKMNSGIAFLFPNEEAPHALDSYAITIDEAENMLGQDFFSNVMIDESHFELSLWFDELNSGDREILPAEKLPAGHFNTSQAIRRMGKKSKICGTVVSTRKSRSGNVWVNLDKQFPNQIFSFYIKKDDLVNFPYDVQKSIDQRVVCVEGKVENLNETPTIKISNENQLFPLKSKKY